MMRSFQLRKILSPHIPDDYDISVSALPTGIDKLRQIPWAMSHNSGSILFFTKTTFEKLLPVAIAILKKKHCYVCVDYVDSDLNKMHPHNVDIHVAASMSAKRELEKIKREHSNIHGEIKLLNHNVDIRLYSAGPNEADTLNIAYLGSRERAYIPASATEKINFIAAGTVREFEKSLDMIHKYNAHYCVAPPAKTTSKRIVKPFTKGFTAAVLGANVIMNRQTDDAELLLGEDYPYFIDNCDDDQIIQMLTKVKATYLKDEWNIARQRMSGIAHLVQPKFLADQMMDIARELHS
jgi:hypothetical protein